ncbi:MAG: spore coat U domain-containing protein [Erythrobacter sp.]
MKIIFRTFAFVAVTSALAAQPVLAQSSGDMPVSATVLANCTVSAAPMVFGPITDFNAGNTDSTSTVVLSCSPNAAYEVQLNDGQNADGGQRRLANIAASEFINYEVYTDPSRTTRWGDTIGSDTVSGIASLAGASTLTVYGRISQGEPAVSVGAYTDLITVTVNF